MPRGILKKGTIKAANIAVISMYAGQEQELRTRLNTCMALKDVEIGTIDSSQGKEWDLVIVCSTRTRENVSGSREKAPDASRSRFLATLAFET